MITESTNYNNRGIEPYNRAEKMTIDQWKDQVQTNAAKLTKDFHAFAEIAMSPPEQMDKAALHRIARDLASSMMCLASSAKSASSIGDTPSDQAMIDGAQRLAHLLDYFFEAAIKLSDNPHDMKTRAEFERAKKEVEEGLLYMNSARTGTLNDWGSESLIQQASAELLNAVQDVVDSSLAAMKTLKDGNKMRDIVNATKKVQGNQKTMSLTAGSY